MKRMIGLLLALLLLVPVCALAELRRGDSGEEVTALQQMLWDTGFIFEEPDGVFGRNTEKAVKWFQEYANLEQSGIVDDRTLDTVPVIIVDSSECAPVPVGAQLDFKAYFFHGV